MHHCLEIPEIQSSIFTFIYDLTKESNGPDRGDMDRFGPTPIVQPTLVALACSCRLFHDTATDVLWELQTSLAPLMCVMPHDLWEWITWDCEEIEPNWWDVEPVILSFKRAIQRTDWERYDHYSPKIRHVKLNVNTGIKLDALAELSAYGPTRQLLPQLQHMEIDAIQNSAFVEYIPSLLSKCLQSLSVGDIDPYDSNEQGFVQRLLISMAGRCPDLTGLTLPYRVRMGEAIRLPQLSLHRILPRFSTLRSVSLYLCDICPAIRKYLSSMDQLQSLSLHGPPYPSYTSNYATFVNQNRDLEDSPFFLEEDFRLQSLEMLMVEPVYPRVILRSTPKTLKHLTMSINANDSVLVNISELPWSRFADLVSLRLEFIRSDNLRSNEESDMLSCLLSLRHLQEISLDSIPSTALTNEWLEQLSVSWPNLMSLRLTQHESDKPRMTLEGLIPISQNCQRLADLSISLLCEPFELRKIVKLSGGGGRVSALRRLVFLDSPLQHPTRVLRCISHMFPLAVHVRGAIGMPWMNDTKWADYDSWKKFNCLLREGFSEGVVSGV